MRCLIFIKMRRKESNNPHILGSENIIKLIIQYSIPAVIGMTLTSLYNIIDSIFIGHGVGALAISGLAITFPIMNLVVALSTLVGVGGATISSLRLGRRDMDGALRILGSVTVLSVSIGIALGLSVLMYIEPILIFFGASNDTLPYAKDFMTVYLCGIPITYLFLGLNNVMRAVGFPRKAMMSSIITVGFNVILAPIFIFKLNWGMSGAALATVISQFVGMIWVLSHFMNKNNYIHYHKGFYKIHLKDIISMFSIGMSPFLINICASMIVVILNTELGKYGGDLAIGAYGIINRILSMFVMVAIGLTMGMQPIVGYNFGAKQIDRVYKTLRYCIYIAFTLTSIAFFVVEIFPEYIARMFTSDVELINISVRGIRISSLFFAFVGPQIVISNFFQSIGMAKISIFLSLTRQLLYLLPFLLIYPGIWGLDGVWYSTPTADFLAVITVIITLIYNIKKINTKYKEEKKVESIS